MEIQDDLAFDFDFAAEERGQLLAETSRTARARRLHLGSQGVPDPADSAAARLLDDLNRESATFSAFPDVIELKEEHFTIHGLTVPLRFQELREDFRFYWLRFPITLHPAENKPFVKLKCGVEFNPGVTEGHLRPRAQAILPDRKFQDLAKTTTSLEVTLDENFQFKADALPQFGVDPVQPPQPATPGARPGQPLQPVTTSGKMDAKLAGQMGFAAGPFVYRVTRALVNHTPPGTERVFWTLEDPQSLEQEEPNFIVVLQVPRAVEQVKISAALEAAHGFNFLAADLGEVLGLVRDRVVTFFRKGAPVRDTKVWDITPNL